MKDAALALLLTILVGVAYGVLFLVLEVPR